MCKHGQTSWKGRVRLKWTSGGSARFQTSETTELEVIANGIWHGKQSQARMLYNHVTQPWSLLFWAQYGEKDKISFFFAIGTDILNIFFFFEPIGLGSFSWTPGMAELAVSLIPFPLVKE